MSVKRQKQQRKGTPPELVKDYTVSFWQNDKIVFETRVQNNIQRLNVLRFAPVSCDLVTITINETNGAENVHIYEIRLY